MYFIYKYNQKYIERKHIPFVQIFFNLLNCSTYVVIAIIGTGDFQNLVTNLIGFILCLIVVFHLYFSLPKKKYDNYLLHNFIIFNIIFQLYYFIFKYNEGLSKYITIIINILMYMSLNIGTYYAFKEKKPDLIPILSAVLGFFASLGWAIYAACLGEHDPITLLSNIFSFLVIISTILSYIYLLKFGSKTSNEKKVEISEGNANNNKENEMKNELTEKINENNSGSN